MADKDQAIKLGHELAAYQESEQGDLKKGVENEFDALWQSIYDVCSLVYNDILDELLTEEEYQEALAWLKKYQSLTKDYQDKEIKL